jgi:hypothetical protein
MMRMSRKQTKIFEITATNHPLVYCSKLPEFWRARKYLGGPFCVYFNASLSIPNGCLVTLSASSYRNRDAELVNFRSIVFNNIATFQDLRFIGKSGRGIYFLKFISFSFFESFNNFY